MTAGSGFEISFFIVFVRQSFILNTGNTWCRSGQFDRSNYSIHGLAQQAGAIISADTVRRIPSFDVLQH